MRQLLTIAACSTLLAFVVPAAAHTDDTFVSMKSAPATGGASVKMAKHGADDPAGDDRGGKGGGNGNGGKGRGGHDDGPGHT